MSKRAFNFCAGPAALPEAVLLRAQAELLDWHGKGLSVMEMSHRSDEFVSIANKAEQDLRDLLSIPSNYKVLFLQGGASQQFAQIALNLLPENGKADYIDTGIWSQKAIEEASRYGTINVAASAKAYDYFAIPGQNEWTLSKDSAYVHYAPNETIGGLEFNWIPEIGDVPLVADIHFDYRIALRVAELGVDCLRINPGNIGREDRVRAVVDAARDRGIPIRIGVNAGSLEKDLQKKYGEPTPEALVESALRHVEHLERLNFKDFKVSVKASDVFMAVAAYRLLAKQIVQPLHLGITEAGGLRSGTVKSAVGLGMLLAEGIGDTIRISLAADPVEEVKVGYDILKSLRLRSRGINFIACPSCSRQNFDVVKTMNELEGRLEDLLVPLDVAVIGCVVNGPGEAKEAHIGLTGGTPNLIYIDGKPAQKLTNDNLVDELERLIREKAAEKTAADASVIVRG
ncbi:flavodoxin-dependent (E)-4-hydroxy-3-methylbut-2-enyl-diphosphate synthase [Pseudomonas syringae pv. actinidiae]|nr:flavodoxin-dependent (E)-4-hydroxy-3-methylbut-2-enyl-diphosphate synthase [Pseudomonas syringae pv. actinidiae]